MVLIARAEAPDGDAEEQEPVGIETSRLRRDGARFGRGDLAPVIDGQVPEQALGVLLDVVGQAELLARAMPVLKVRAHDLNELADGARFLFAKRPLELTDKAAALLDDAGRDLLALVSDALHGETDWTSEALEATTKALAERLGLGLGKLAQPMRAALTGSTTSPGIFDVLVLLGRDESLARIDSFAAPAAASV